MSLPLILSSLHKVIKKIRTIISYYNQKIFDNVHYILALTYRVKPRNYHHILLPDLESFEPADHNQV